MSSKRAASAILEDMVEAGGILGGDSQVDKLTRRKLLVESLRSMSIGIAGLRGSLRSLVYDDEISSSERSDMAQVARDFMQKFDVPGLSVAIARDGDLIYKQAFGVSDTQTRKELTCTNLFRIASVSKTITSVAIFTLYEKRQLKLTDKVFGENGILGTDYPGPYQQYVDQITVEQLLTHTCGGWPKGPGDPMLGFNDLDHRQLIHRTVTKTPLTSPPGTKYAYSNFGYCVLGRVIEKIAGMAYSEYADQEVLSRCGITSMVISGNTPGEHAANEVAYYGQSGENPYSVNVRRMDSNGGWLATAPDLVLFLTYLDHLLKPETISIMTTGSLANRSYAKGWSVREPGIWSHNGSLAGSTTEILHTATGFCWATLTNTRRQPSAAIDNAVSNVGWEMARKVSAWKARLPNTGP